MSGKTIAIATIVILIAMAAFSNIIFKPQLENPDVEIKEAPLHKNTEFQLAAGEVYVYAYLMNRTQINITYEVLKGPNCTLIRLIENRDYADTCVDRYGMDSTGLNSAFENPSVLFFKPWMLALDDNWRWNTTMYLNFDSTYHNIGKTDYRVMRTENYRGRNAFVVEILSETGPVEYEWIDSEKRIILKTVGEGYSMEMIEGLELD